MKCYIIAGPNGAGKTTFARTFLPFEAECLNFINADLIAEGLSPFKPESVAFEAGRLLLGRIDQMTCHRESFAFESTLSGLNYMRRIQQWKSVGYQTILYYLKLPHEQMAVERVRMRVAEGGHHIPDEVIRRRFHKSWHNMQTHYKSAVDTWMIFDNSGDTPILLEESQ